MTLTCPLTETRGLQKVGRSRVLIVQYAGDYLAAYERMQQNSGEIYYGHNYILEQVTRLGAQHGDAAILCCNSSREYVVRLPDGLTVMGANANLRHEQRRVLEYANQYNPTHLVVFGPLTSIFRWGIETERRTIGIFADSFETNMLRRLVRYGRLNRVLNSNRIEWVANHGLNACRSLEGTGVTAEKIIPWDFPHKRRPSELSPKMDWDEQNPTMLFVGALIKTKGVGEVIKALRYLRDRGLPFRLQVVGEGQTEEFRTLAHCLEIDDYVDFLGCVPNDRVFELMRQATVVTVPSRHEYPEGMPLTIFEALCARTPIVASDHAMFRGHLRDRETALIFPAGNARKLASKIEELVSDRLLYRDLSRASVATWEGLQVPARWGDLLHHWVSGEASDVEWLREQSLASRS